MATVEKSVLIDQVREVGAKHVHAHRLTAHSVHVGELGQFVVGQPLAVLGLSFDQFGTQLVLDARVQRQKVKDSSEGVRRRVHSREDECST